MSMCILLVSLCAFCRGIISLHSFIRASGFISHSQFSQCSQAGCTGLIKDVFASTYRQAQVSTDILGYTFKTTFLFSSKNRTLSELILSGTQQGSGMPGMIPTAFTMLWIVAWFDGRTIWKREGDSYCFIYKQSLSQMNLESYNNNGFCFSKKVNVCGWVAGPCSIVSPSHFQVSCTGCIQQKFCVSYAALINTRGGHWWHSQQSAAWRKNVPDYTY